MPTANTANSWGSIALFILEEYHRVQTNEYAAVFTYCHHSCTPQPSRPYACTSYHTFHTSLGRTAKFKMWPIRHWGGEAHSKLQYIHTYSSIWRVLVRTRVSSSLVRGAAYIPGTWYTVHSRTKPATESEVRGSVSRGKLLVSRDYLIAEVIQAEQRLPHTT